MIQTCSSGLCKIEVCSNSFLQILVNTFTFLEHNSLGPHLFFVKRKENVALTFCLTSPSKEKHASSEQEVK